MTRSSVVTICMSAALVIPAWGQPNFFDDFESPDCMGNWQAWPEESCGDNECYPTEPLTCEETSNSISPTHASKAIEADPFGYCSYADFGATPGAVYAEVWVWDEFDDDGTDYDRPVSNMLALAGASADPSNWTDYLQLGVVSWYHPSGLSDGYWVRTRQQDSLGGGYIDTGVSRKPGWTKLAIAADSLIDGGLVRFYIDDQLVATSYRTAGVDLQFIRLGVNFKSYDPFWYDDVLVSDERPPDDLLRYDVDEDGDVDQDDFGAIQACYTGMGGMYTAPGCQLLDIDGDLDIDAADLDAFEACASGPAIPADPACDNVAVGP